MSGREISQLAKKLVQAQLIMAETEQSLITVKIDESMPFSDREIHILNAMRQLTNGRAILQDVLKELQKRMSEGPN
jgi:hypothetical protein